MATEFTRLYRELSRVEASGKPNDISYERERKALLASMGHDVGEIATATKANRHHGRMARRRLKDKLQDSIVVDKKLEKMRSKQILDVTAQNNEVRELLRSLGQNDSRAAAAGGGGRKMEASFWTKYTTLFPDNPNEAAEHTPSNSHTNSVNNNSSINTNTTATGTGATAAAAPRKHVPFEPTRGRDVSVLRKDFTNNKWSKDERRRINTLYWEIKKPHVASKEAWRDYLTEFAARFKSYYPERKTVDIVEKVKAFIKHRSMKEPGEREHWTHLHAAHAHTHGCGAPAAGEGNNCSSSSAATVATTMS
jgi:hypothetical protein